MKFIKIVLGSCLGVILASVAFMLIGGIIVSMVGAFSSSDKLPKKGLLKLELNQPVPEKTNNVGFTYQDISTNNVVGLHDIIKTIKHAATDDRINGILLKLSNVQTRLSATTNIKDALLEFKKSGKPIFSYSDYLTQKNYLLASTADHVALNPNGLVYMQGFGIVMPFYKDALDKLGVSMQVFYAGDYKSATEPYRYNKMSKYNRTQLREYINDLYGQYVDDLKENKGISKDVIEDLTDNDVFIDAKKAQKVGLIDEVVYEDQMEDLIKEKLKYDEDQEIEFIHVKNYYKEALSSNFGIKDKIAVVYAEGEIKNSEDKNGIITYKRYADILEKLSKDKKVKGVVLRVNSGGGDALVSDNIWREVELLKKSGKPVVASFGGVAASGGYYIAAGADEIIAHENSLTGSIGVFGMIPEAEKLLNEKLGIHHDTVGIGDHSTAYNIFYKLTPKQLSFLQENVQRIYDKFLGRVAKGRNMELAKVKEIAQGRIYTGTRALELGLIDQIGSLDDAVERAADLAKLEKYRVVEYPKFKEPIQQLIDEVMSGKVSFNKKFILSKEFEVLSEAETLMKTWYRPMTKLPFEIEIE